MILAARLKTFAEFRNDVIIGDDWRLGPTSATRAALTYCLSISTSAPTSWLVPVVIAVLLPVIHRATRHAPKPAQH